MMVLRNTKGIAIVYVTLFLLVLGLLFFALGIDAGWLAYVRTQGQGAVDASALRGAAAIPNYNNTSSANVVYSMAKGLNTDNTVINQDAGITDSDIELCPADADGKVCTSCCVPGTPAPPVNGVKVSRPYAPRTFFSRLMGAGSNANVTVSSVAWLGGPVEVETQNLVPVAVRSCKVNYPTTCDLPQLIQSPEPSDNSAFTTFNVTGGATCKQLAQGIVPPGVNTSVSLDDRINLVGSGQVTDCLKKLDDRYKDCTQAICNNPADPLYTSCIGVVPIVDTGCPGADTSNMSSGKVVGFASICFIDITVPPQPKTITASLECIDPPAAPGSIGGGVFYGTYADRPVLVK